MYTYSYRTVGGGGGGKLGDMSENQTWTDGSEQPLI